MHAVCCVYQIEFIQIQATKVHLDRLVRYVWYVLLTTAIYFQPSSPKNCERQCAENAQCIR